jgi:hypothetical protein
MSLKLPADFVADYEALLRSVASELINDREYCAFTARCGNAYARDGLMFYGRATNGWTRESSFTCDTFGAADSLGGGNLEQFAKTDLRRSRHAQGRDDYNVILAQHPQGRPPLAVAEDVLSAVSSL